MEKFLVKYKHIENIFENEYIAATYTNDPVKVVQLIKEVNSIKLNDEWYTYDYSEFVPAESKEDLNVILIYVDGNDDEYIN